MPVKSKLLMLVLSSPSGAGKTTLSKKIQESDPSFKVSISHTTRKARPNEVDGVDYHFVNKKQFEDLLNKKEFYEYAQIFDNFYGTSKTSVNNLTKKGYNVLFDIDWQGAKQLTKFKELNLIKIFILPPSVDELEKRLIARNQDDKDAIKKRLKAYTNDITHSKSYDYVIVNDKVEKCYNEIKKIISNYKSKIN